MPEDFKWLEYSDFGGGLNDVQYPGHLADNELSELVNFEFVESNHLHSRGGFPRYNISPDFTSRITSIYNYITAAGVNNIIVTTAAEIYKDTAGVFTSIKGATTLPSNTYWKWVTFNDLAIGVNGSSAAVDDIVKWNGAGNIAALALTGISGAPVGAFAIEVFNARIWVVFHSHPNRLYFCTLGNPEDWSLSGGFIEVGFNDGDNIVGIKAHRKKLFILKRRSIHVLETSINGQINTDPNGWNVDVLSQDGGCISQFGIQIALNDLLFPSDDGIISLGAVQEFGDFNAAVVSRKINRLSALNLSIDTFSSVVARKSMYLIAVPKTKAGTVNNVFYLFDYKDVREEQKGRWASWESAIVNPSVMAIVLINGEKTLFVGSDSPNPQIYKYNESVFSDHNNTPIVKKVSSKSYDFQLGFERKECNRIALGINFSGADLSATWKLKINNDNRLINSQALSINNIASGGVWDTAVWDVDTFSSGESNDQIIDRKVKGGTVGNRGRTFMQQFENSQLNQEIFIRSIAFEAGKLTSENA